MAAGANEVHQSLDAPLLDGLKAHDPRASARFFDRYAKEINGLVWRLLGPDAEHADIVQTVFLEAIAGIGRVQSDATLGAWLRGIAVNTVRAELRRRKRRRLFFISDGNSAIDSAPALADHGRAKRMQRVYTLLDNLPVDDRQAFALRYIEAHQLIDAAALAGCSLATFKRRLKRATDKMLGWAQEDPEIAKLGRRRRAMTDDQQAERLGRAIARDMNAMQRNDLGAQKAAFLRAQDRPPKRALGVWLAVASSAVALALVVAYVSRAVPVDFEVAGQPGNEGQDVTAAGRDVPLQFADGSTLSLAAGSNLHIDKASRKAVVVRLGSGHLTAAVTHGTALRWRFDANRYSVHIVGTRFEITTDERGIGVDVTEGAVRISGLSARGEEIRVVAGQHFSGHDGTYSVDVRHDDPPPPPEEPAPPRPVESHPSNKPNAPTNDNWRRQLAHGQYDGAIATVKRLGLAEITGSASANELTDLADAARLARDAETAKRVFESLRQRFPKSPETKRVPFLLGRVAMELEQDPRAAAKQFAAYIAGNPHGELVEEAFGREMEAWRAAGEAAKAKETAIRYLERFPEGTYAALAHAIGGS